MTGLPIADSSEGIWDDGEWVSWAWINEQIERDQVERVRAIREKRDPAKAESALTSLTEAATGTANLLPRILVCVESEVTVGEISHKLRKVWGEYQEAVTV